VVDVAEILLIVPLSRRVVPREDVARPEVDDRPAAIDDSRRARQRTRSRCGDGACERVPWCLRTSVIATAGTRSACSASKNTSIGSIPLRPSEQTASLRTSTAAAFLSRTRTLHSTRLTSLEWTSIER
jgi:hypothetical protein